MARRGFGFGSVLRNRAALGGGVATYRMFNFSSGQSVEVDSHASLGITNDFSGCAWVYANNRNQSQRVLSKFGTVGDRAWFFDISALGRLSFGHYSDGTSLTSFSTTVDVPLTTRSLVHFRLTGGTLYVGINGATEQSVARGAVFNSTAPNRIGSAGTPFFSDDLDISQPMLFSSGSSLANFALIYNSGNPAVYDALPSYITDDAVMALNLSSYDSSLVDLSGNSNDGTAIGGAVANGSDIEWSTVYIYKMFNFDSGQGVEVADHATLDLTNDFSGCAWVYANNRNTFQRVMCKYTTAGNQGSWALNVHSGGNLNFFHSTDGLAFTQFTSTLIVPLNTLTLVHFRLTGGTLYLGINDGAEQSVAKGAVFSSAGPVEIGTLDSTNYSDDFDISQSIIFNSGSSLANFATIYNGGDPVVYDALPSYITDDAVMAINLSSYDNSLVDESGKSNDGTAIGGVVPDGSEITWET